MASLQDYYINDQFWFYKGEIGVDDCLPYLQKIPRIDLVYAALPKPENFQMWYSLAKKQPITHETFLQGLFLILKEVDAPEYHIEVGETNRDPVRNFFKQWRKFKHEYEQELWYSAPLHTHTKGMAKCRKPTKIIVFSTQPKTFPQVKYSHEYVNEILKRMSKKKGYKVFDPVMGKGLLARYAKQWDHSCYGIDMNEKRLKCVMESILQ